MISRSVRTAILATAALVTLAGCTAGPGPFGARVQTPVPGGSTLVLQEALDVPSGEARVFMQDGRVVREGLISGFNRFRPRCSFGLEKQNRGDRLVDTIQPGRFRMGEPRQRMYIDARLADGVQVAALDGATRLAEVSPGGPDPGYFTYVLEFPLSSPDQPQVDDFTCKVDRPGEWRGKLGVETIRQATGDIVRVELAEPDTDTDTGY